MPSRVVWSAGRTNSGRGWGGAGLVSRTTCGREAEFGTGEQIGHGLRVVDRAVEILEGAELAAAIDAAGRMIRRGARWLIGIDADEQGALGLRSQRPREDQAKAENAATFTFISAPTANVLQPRTGSDRELRAAALPLPRSARRTDSRAWLAHRGRTTRCKVIQASGPENRSTSYRLKHCPSGEVAHPALQEKALQEKALQEKVSQEKVLQEKALQEKVFVTASSLRFFDVNRGARVSAEVSCRNMEGYGESMSLHCDCP